MLVQVCESMANPRTRKRELAAVSEAMNEMNLKTAQIVTRGEEEQVATQSGTIEVMSAWRFLLSLPVTQE